jgi:hypothetical protein
MVELKSVSCEVYRSSGHIDVMAFAEASVFVMQGHVTANFKSRGTFQLPVTTSDANIVHAVLTELAILRMVLCEYGITDGWEQKAIAAAEAVDLGQVVKKLSVHCVECGCAKLLGQLVNDKYVCLDCFQKHYIVCNHCHAIAKVGNAGDGDCQACNDAHYGVKA